MIVSQVENNPSTSAYDALGSGAQTCLAYNTSIPSFQPVFNPTSYTWNDDPLENNHRQVFTFWRTDFLDRSWKNSGLGTSNIGGSSPTLGAYSGSISATGNVVIAKKNPTAAGAGYVGSNSVNLSSDATAGTNLQLYGGANVACVYLAPFDNTSPIIPIASGPLNNYNGYSQNPGTGVYPGFKGE